jgi:ankyrin
MYAPCAPTLATLDVVNPPRALQIVALSCIGCNIHAVNTLGQSGLSQAAAYGNSATLAAMLRVGADAAQYSPGKGMGALFRACYNGHVACVRILIEHKADVDAVLADGTSCCCVAAENGHSEILSILIQARANFDRPDFSGCSALWRACDRGNVAPVRLLLSALADVNAVSKDGRSALHVSAARGHTQVVAELLNAGAKACCENEGDLEDGIAAVNP